MLANFWWKPHVWEKSGSWDMGQGGGGAPPLPLFTFKKTIVVENYLLHLLRKIIGHAFIGHELARLN